MTTFPALRPAVRTWTPGEYPHAQLNSLSGRSQTVRLSAVMLRSQLRLSFAALTQAQMLSIAAHYLAQQGGYLGFELPTEVWSGANASSFTLTGHLWRYAEPPTVEDLPCGTGYDVEIRLETVPNEGASVAGLSAFVFARLVAGGAGASNGANLTATVTLAAGSALGGNSQANGANLTAAVLLAAGAGSSPDRVVAGGSFTVTTSLSAGVGSGGSTDAYFSNVSLLLHMDGSNNSTTFTDSSTNGLSLTVNGDTKISTTQSKFGGAAGYFDGTGDYLNTASSALFNFGGGTSFTIEFWIYTSNAQQNAAGLVSQRFSNYAPFALQLYNGKLRWVVSNATVNGWSAIAVATTGTISNNTWQHIALVGDGTNVKAYVDATEVLSTSQPSWTSANRTLYIGSDGDAAFQGYIDDLRVTTGVARTITVPTAAFPNS